MNLCYLGLGGNVGDVVATMDAALDRLDARRGISVQGVSRVFETAPVGVDAGGRFLNAAVEIQTQITHEELLDHLKAVERESGRTAGVRWTERVIDLDLLLFDAEIIDRPRLIVPHPHLWYRRFVLDPLVEIARDVIHPRLDESLGQLHSRLTARPLPLALFGGSPQDRQTAAAVLHAYKPLVQVHTVATDCPAEFSASPQRGVQLGFLHAEHPDSGCRRCVDLLSLPGSLSDATASVMAAALDEPRAYSRPLRRMP